jgi:hypothetical protein
LIGVKSAKKTCLQIQAFCHSLCSRNFSKIYQETYVSLAKDSIGYNE